MPWTYNQTGEDGELQIDGVLSVEDSWWYDGLVVARNIRNRISKSRNITVYINSPGGDVMAGAEIYTALREHSEKGLGKVTVKVSGIAASAASVVAMAGDEIYMSPVAYMMIHNPWSSVTGNAADMRKEAQVLDTITEGIINAYERRTGKSRAELQAMMEAETYMSAQTCVDEGFADGLLWEEPKQATEQRGQTANLGMRNIGRAAAMAMLEAHTGQPAEPATPQSAEEAEKRKAMARRAEILAQALQTGAGIRP